MGRKYVKERISENFVYPNNEVQEYGIEIVHDINDNSVSGTVTNFVASQSGTSLQLTFTYSWALNGAEPFIDEQGELHLLSVHMMGPESTYYKPYRLTNILTTPTTGLTGTSSSVILEVTPERYGVTSFTSGTYYFEIRMIGHRAIFPICAEDRVDIIAPTPTPTPTPTFPGCTCISYTVTNESLEATATVEWINCDTGVVESDVIDPDTGIGICACDGTVSVVEGAATVVAGGECGPATPTPTPTNTVTPTPSCSYKTWVIQECTLGTCSGGICTCQGSTAKTVYTDCTVTDLTDLNTAIYENTALTNPFTGDFVDGGTIWNSSGSNVTFVCTLGGPC